MMRCRSTASPVGRRRTDSAGGGSLLAAHGEAFATWCERAGQHFVDCLQHIANVIDPAVIIVGGRLPAALLQDIVCASGLPQSELIQRLAGNRTYEYIAKIWTSGPARFIFNPIRHMPGLKTW